MTQVLTSLWHLSAILFALHVSLMLRNALLATQGSIFLLLLVYLVLMSNVTIVLQEQAVWGVFFPTHQVEVLVF
jgi:hypothetical protein